MTYQIVNETALARNEKGELIPNWYSKPKETRGRAKKYPWDTIEAGQSFVIGPEEENRPLFASIKNQASRLGRQLQRKFLCTEMADGSYKVFRSK